MHEEIGHHSIWNWPIVGPVHADTILTTWIAMAIVIPLLIWVGRSYGAPRASRTQTVLEGLINYISDLVVSTVGRQGEPFVPFFIALFVFLIALNEIGFLPLKQLGLPFGGSPTADLNTASAYAIMIFVLIQVSGIRKSGLGFYGHLLKPVPYMLPINLLEEVVRPITLALRLFFNILIGELLLIVIAVIITSQIKIGPVDVSLFAAVMPLFITIFNFLIGLLQAFVFVLLSIVYLSLALADEH
jgi:F-type H+-transporting ATPase subunit a